MWIQLSDGHHVNMDTVVSFDYYFDEKHMRHLLCLAINVVDATTGELSAIYVSHSSEESVKEELRQIWEAIAESYHTAVVTLPNVKQNKQLKDVDPVVASALKEQEEREANE